MAKKKEETLNAVEKQVRAYIVTLKEKDENGLNLYMDCDYVLPTPMFGESCPMLMCITDDSAFFIPVINICWFQQVSGVKRDTQIARALHEQKLAAQSKKSQGLVDVA